MQVLNRPVSFCTQKATLLRRSGRKLQYDDSGFYWFRTLKINIKEIEKWVMLMKYSK